MEEGFVYGFVNSGQGCWKCTSITFAIKLKFSSVQFSSACLRTLLCGCSSSLASDFNCCVVTSRARMCVSRSSRKGTMEADHEAIGNELLKPVVDQARCVQRDKMKGDEGVKIARGKRGEARRGERREVARARVRLSRRILVIRWSKQSRSEQQRAKISESGRESESVRCVGAGGW